VGRQQLLLWAPVCKHHFLYCLRWCHAASGLPTAAEQLRAQRTAIADGVPHDAFEVFKAALVVSKSAPHVLPDVHPEVLRAVKKTWHTSARTGRVARNRDLFRTQALELPAFVTLQIVDFSFNWIAKLVPMHLKWELITRIKHYRKPDENKDPFDDY